MPITHMQMAPKSPPKLVSGYTYKTSILSILQEQINILLLSVQSCHDAYNSTVMNCRYIFKLIERYYRGTRISDSLMLFRPSIWAHSHLKHHLRRIGLHPDGLCDACLNTGNSNPLPYDIFNQNAQTYLWPS